MRVTKTIREYIEKEVKNKVEAKYQDEYKELSDMIEKLESEYDYELKKILNRANAEFLELCKKLGYNTRSDYDYISNNGYPRNEKLKSNRANLSKLIKNEIKEKVDEILITLELGGNKSDLDEMLSKI